MPIRISSVSVLRPRSLTVVYRINEPRLNIPNRNLVHHRDRPGHCRWKSHHPPSSLPLVPRWDLLVPQPQRREKAQRCKIRTLRDYTRRISDETQLRQPAVLETRCQSESEYNGDLRDGVRGPQPRTLQPGSPKSGTRWDRA